MAGFKYAIVGAIVIGVLALGVGSAAAATNAESVGAFTATSSNFSITTGKGLKCEKVVLKGTAAGRSGTANEFTFTNCVNEFFNIRAIVTATTPWSLTFNGSTTSFGNVNLHVVLPDIPNCSYDTVGSASATNAYPTISSWAFAASPSGTGPMTYKNVSKGCENIGIHGPAAGSFKGTFTVSPPIKVS